MYVPTDLRTYRFVTPSLLYRQITDTDSSALFFLFFFRVVLGETHTSAPPLLPFAQIQGMSALFVNWDSVVKEAEHRKERERKEAEARLDIS